ncbi:hypothetical protein Tco_1392001 [Tanacetum coccineum]
MSMSVQKSQVHKMARFIKMAKRLCLVDDLKMLKITMSNTSSRNKLNPEINDHYNILTGECQKDELKTKDKALLMVEAWVLVVVKSARVKVVDGVTDIKRKQTVADLSQEEKLRYDSDIKVVNILLLGLPVDIYTLINHYQTAKEIWDYVKEHMEGTKMTKQERESMLYDEFDKFTSEPGESIHSYYLRYAKLLNDMK